MKVEESLNLTFDETPPPPKTSPLEDDELIKEEAIEGSGIETISECGFGIMREKNQIARITMVFATFYGMLSNILVFRSKETTPCPAPKTEAEYVSARKACQQALWMKQALIHYGVRLDDIPIMCDNRGAIDLSKNPVQHSRTKHIEIHHHFLRDNVQKGNISIEKVSSKDNIADILTKPLKREPFIYLRLGLGMMEQID
ncbi:hypothetical protein Tco_0638531 [Tanacetum coccineum]